MKSCHSASERFFYCYYFMNKCSCILTFSTDGAKTGSFFLKQKRRACYVLNRDNADISITGQTSAVGAGVRAGSTLREGGGGW